MTTLQVLPEFRGGGLARVLVQAVAKDLTRRGVKAIEAFGDSGPDDGDPAASRRPTSCTSVGFKTVRPHPRWPRLRLELRTAITWKEDVEAALEQLLEQRHRLHRGTAASAPSEPSEKAPARTDSRARRFSQSAADTGDQPLAIS